MTINIGVQLIDENNVGEVGLIVIELTSHLCKSGVKKCMKSDIELILIEFADVF